MALCSIGSGPVNARNCFGYYDVNTNDWDWSMQLRDWWNPGSLEVCSILRSD